MMSYNFILVVFAFVASFIFSKCSPKRTVEIPDLVIKNVNVVPMDEERVIEKQDVLIKDGKILNIIPAKDMLDYRYSESVDIIQANNEYLIPALADMHVHMGWGNKYFLDQFLGYGITTVRVMNGAQVHLDWKDSIQGGTLRGPDLIVASELIDGNPPSWGEAHFTPIVTDPDSVEWVVDDQMGKGFDFLKLYSRLSPEVYKKFLEVAADRNIPIAGHLPYRVHPDSLLSPQTGSVEHLSGYPRMIYGGPILNEAPPKDHGIDLIAAKWIDTKKLEKVAQKTVEFGVWNCPTLVLYENSNDSLFVNTFSESEVARNLPKGLVDWWQNSGGFSGEDYKRLVQLNRTIVKELHKTGAKLLAGTDTPNPFLAPGYALHQELQWLTNAGLSPYEALKTATVNPALYLGKEAKKGRVLRGMDADLLLISFNPLENIENTLDIRGVIKGGEFMFKSDLLKPQQ
ncbi:amidohydrolase family protein [Xanthovirga aplysinae]|uniref:amidohydrolase family protein n=1 Tax=Xanthovirga aplysinae TaxID=2529853 RepID=UPI0012BBDE36|nr:amidohydrolase family protein [Xanthovirga aplysinae]MTI33149.1 hypothetical protein [Xanthovirga aplysinae]